MRRFPKHTRPTWFHTHVTCNGRRRRARVLSEDWLLSVELLKISMTAPPISLLGPHPGQLDQTQPSRVLRHPDARLLFASFHPLTASNVHHAHDGSSKPKRIVIEMHPSGLSHWRFVPRARLAEGVVDEGSWPRLVDFLGWVAYVASRCNLLICAYPAETFSHVTRISGIFINLTLSMNVLSRLIHTLLLSAQRWLRRHHSLGPLHRPDHPHLPKALRKEDDFQRLHQVSTRTMALHRRSVDMSFMSIQKAMKTR
jgi:hypothetical protein